MDFTGVYHKASEQMCYPLNEDELIVNLKTGYDVKRVFIYYGDPFEAGILGGKEQWEGKKEEICFKKHLRHHLWWTTTLTPRFKRCKYYFELHTEEETWYYFENGFLSEEQIGMEGRMLQCFVMPWMNPADVNSTPDWVNDTYGTRSSRTGSATGHLRKTARISKNGARGLSPTQRGSAETWKGSERSFPIYMTWGYRVFT